MIYTRRLARGLQFFFSLDPPLPGALFVCCVASIDSGSPSASAAASLAEVALTAEEEL